MEEPELRLAIDENRLDAEWQGHGEMAYAWALYAAAAQADLEKAKGQLELTAADLDLSIRENPDVYGVPKVTEGVVKSAIVAHPKYQKCKRRIVEAKNELDNRNAAVAALKDRKHALQGLVELHLTGYFGAPKQSSRYEERPERASGVRRKTRKKEDNDD